MRLKVVIVIVLLATGALAIIGLMSKAVRPQSPPSASANDVSVSSANRNSSNSASTTRAPASLSVSMPMVFRAPVAVTNDDPIAHANYVRQRIKELDALAMNNDTQSRDAILSELKNNPDKKIRAAALQAAIQFDDRSVVPPMQQIADQTDDPEEKANILAAIDYINLPSYTEYMASHAVPNAPTIGNKLPHPVKSPPSGTPGQ